MLELINITKKFGDKVIFDGFDLTIKSGEVVAIAGPSGGGKTTLLRMLAGLETIDAGQVIFDGETVALNDLITRNLLGFVFQDFQLFPHMTVLENLVLSPMKTMQVSKDIAIAKEINKFLIIVVLKVINNLIFCICFLITFNIRRTVRLHH